jgi:hypothetical protein
MSATDLINAFAADTTAGAWPNVDRQKMADGLKARVGNPSAIHQRGSPLCGPANFWRTIAKNDPEVYAQAGIDLYNTGKATVGSLSIKPGSTLLNSAPQHGMQEADFVLLCTLRDSDNWVFSPAGVLGGSAAGITRPGTLESWFRAAEYTNIASETYLSNVSKPTPNVLRVEASKASKTYRSTHTVLFLINADMLKSATQDSTALIPDHWVALTDAISPDPIDAGPSDGLSFKVYTWGDGSRAVPKDSNKPLIRDDFLDHYYGYLAVKK